MGQFAPFIYVSSLSDEQEASLLRVQDESDPRSWEQLLAELHWLQELVDDAKKQLSQGTYRGAVLSFSQADRQTSLTPFFIAAVTKVVGERLGELLIQNEQGDHLVYVYDRDRELSMHKGSRYHQTREGGSLHTDNVNIPTPWEFLLFTCLAPAEVGGESILVDGHQVHLVLKEKFPRVLEILEAPFIWEMRGVAQRMYEAPVISYDQNHQPLFRYLRPYMVAAHTKANRPMSVEQLYALDVLDALLESEKMQCRYEMSAGDMLVTNDAQVFHGRTCFSDSLDAVDLHQYKTSPQKKLKRTMVRLWIKKK